MADILTPRERSERMRRIKGKDTKLEVRFRKILHRDGFRYIKNHKKLPGKPDIVLPKYNTVIFIHGCFWHRHEKCTRLSVPKTNTEYWEEKFKRNIDRDKKVVLDLHSLGWEVYIVWECQINTIQKAEYTARKLETALVKRTHAPSSTSEKPPY